MSDLNFGAVGCLLIMGILSGGAYYAYYKVEAWSDAKTQKSRQDRRGPLVQCLAFADQPPLDQPYIDAALEQCVKACRSSEIWKYEEGETNKRRGEMCLRAGMTLYRCRQETYLSTNPKKIFEEGCKFVGILPDTCRDRYDKFTQPWLERSLPRPCSSLERGKAIATSIRNIGYSAKHRVLDVEWKSGVLQRAVNVSPEFHRRFLEAEYQAAFFGGQAKNAGYTVVRLTVD